MRKKRLESATTKKGSEPRRNPKQPLNSVKEVRAYSYEGKDRAFHLKVVLGP
jgi:hypothetical protein